MFIYTESKINEDGMDEETKSKWKNYIYPILAGLATVFMQWAMSDTPISQMNLVKSVEHVVKVVEDYQFPIEDVEFPIDPNTD